MNGQISNFENLEVTKTLDDNQVKEIAQNDFYTSQNIKISAIEHVILKLVTENDIKFFSTAKIQYSSIIPLKNITYYIDYQTGEIAH